MLPQDPEMLVSYLNLKLRDDFASLDDLCDSLDEDKEELLKRIKAAGHFYDEEHNCFK